MRLRLRLRWLVNLLEALKDISNIREHFGFFRYCYIQIDLADPTVWNTNFPQYILKINFPGNIDFHAVVSKVSLLRIRLR